MIPEQLAVATEREAPHAFLSPPRRAGGDPLLDPLCERDLVGSDVLTGVAGAEQLAQFLARIAKPSVERDGESRAVDPIAQTPGIGTARINATIAVGTFAYLSSPVSRISSS
jgi:hypothetical protein